jgi:hypothetical protein
MGWGINIKRTRSKWNKLFFFSFLVALGFELRDSHLLGRWSTTWDTPPTWVEQTLLSCFLWMTEGGGVVFWNYQHFLQRKSKPCFSYLKRLVILPPLEKELFKFTKSFGRVTIIYLRSCIHQLYFDSQSTWDTFSGQHRGSNLDGVCGICF